MLTEQSLLVLEELQLFFSLSPIFSMIMSIIVFKSEVNLLFINSLIFMIIGIYLTASDKNDD